MIKRMYGTIQCMTPDASKHDPECAPVLLMALRKCGLSGRAVADHIGLHVNHISYLKNGHRTDGTPVKIKYPVQFCLECLLEAASTLQKK